VEAGTKQAQQAAQHGPRISVPNAILIARRSGQGYARVTLGGFGPEQQARPGQFVMIRRFGSKSLPRAFSVFSSGADQIELFIKVDGLLREVLASAPLGTQFEIRGPYGTPYDERVDPSRSYILVGGGSGIAPLLFLQSRWPERVAGLVLGFRHAGAERLLPSHPLLVEARDGKRAHEGLADVWQPGLGVIACGPDPMLRAIASEHSDQQGIYVSLEARLACGIGSCLGCTIPTTRGPQRICRDGPLFDLSELPWLR